MKSKNKTNIVFWAIFFGVALIFLGLFLFLPKTTSNAETDDSYYIADYDIRFEYKEGRTFSVSESITAVFTRSGKHGIIRDLPVNSGEVYTSIQADDAFKVQPGIHYISVWLGDEDYFAPVNREVVYRITYDLKIPAPDGSDNVYVNLIGGGWATTIKNATCTLVLPASPEKLLVNTADFDGAYAAEGGTVRITCSDLAPFTPVTVSADLPAGSMGNFAPEKEEIAAVVIAAALLLAALLIGICVPRSEPTPIVNVMPPDGMDPLLAGALIDGSVQNEDITSLIYYWASKKYLTIDFSKQDDPVLNKLADLPADASEHERVVFERLFFGRRTVQISSLAESFYATASKARTLVRSETPKLFSTTSKCLAGAAAALSFLLCFFTVFLRGLHVNTDVQLFIAAAAILPFALVFWLGYLSVRNKRKSSAKARIGLLAAQLGICALFDLIVSLVLPQTYLFGLIKPFFFALTALTAALAPYLLRENKSYIEAVNPLLGFRDFLLLAEKDRLETLLEENPAYYYDILPYAQVLGVSDIWEEKFKDIDMQPPSWAISGNNMLLNFIVINAALRSANRSMTQVFVSRPSSSGRSGGGFRGGGGFHGGGGFGGGGGRSW